MWSEWPAPALAGFVWAVGEPLLTPRALDRLYRHAPNPPDVLGIQLVIVSAVAATVDVTATLSALAIPAIGSSFPARTARNKQCAA